MTTPLLLGICYDGASSYRRGPALAPDAVRGQLHSGSANWATELGVELGPDRGSWVDLGNIEATTFDDLTTAEAADHIASYLAARNPDGAPLLAIGGDHSVTYPLLRALSDHHDTPPTIVHIDAHPDLYDEFDGDRFSHASPFARIMEDGLAARLIQIGIRTLNEHGREQVERFGVEVYPAATWQGTLPAISGPVYVSIDVDGLDPAFAPGVSHVEPGGITTREVLAIVHHLGANEDVELVGADVVEINPTYDVNNMTAMLGAKLVKELLGMMVT